MIILNEAKALQDYKVLKCLLFLKRRAARGRFPAKAGRGSRGEQVTTASSLLDYVRAAKDLIMEEKKAWKTELT